MKHNIDLARVAGLVALLHVHLGLVESAGQVVGHQRIAVSGKDAR